MYTVRKLLPGIETTLVYRHDLRDVPEPAVTAGVSVGELRSPNLALLRLVGPVDELQLAERAAREDICYVGYAEGGRAAHYAWVQRTGRHHIDPAGVWCNVWPAQAWIYDCYTAKWARRRGIYPTVLSAALARLKQSGVRECLIYARRSNATSIRGIERVGFRLAETLFSIRLGAKATLIGRQG